MTDRYLSLLSRIGREVNNSSIRQMGTMATRAPDLVSFAAGFPDPTCFPWEAFEDIAHTLLSSRRSEVLQYGSTRGLPALIAGLLPVLADRGIQAVAGEVLVTTGAQQGLDLVARVLTEPGDAVFVERPTYTGAISAFQNAGAALCGVAQDEEGIDLADLTEQCASARTRGLRPKLLYLVPNFQNPTGRLLAPGRRATLVAWAVREGVLIIEDDPYGSLYFDAAVGDRDTCPLKALDAEGCVIYLSSFSKILAPGLRVGWMVGPASLIERFEAAKQSIDLLSGSFDQHMALGALDRGLLGELAPTLRQVYARKCQRLESSLIRECGDLLTWSTPRGGFFLWARLPPLVCDTALLERALEHQVIFVVGSAFDVGGSCHDRIRLSFSAPEDHRLAEGAKRLARALADLT